MELTSYLTDGRRLPLFGGIASLFCLFLRQPPGSRFRRISAKSHAQAQRRDAQGGFAPNWRIGNHWRRCYSGAMHQSGYREAVVDYIRVQAKPPDKFSHQARLYRLAVQLAEGKPYDDDVLYTAAWMHDLGVFVGHRPEDPAALAAGGHLAFSTRQVPQILRQFGF